MLISIIFFFAALAAASYEVNFHEHFATEELNKAAPHYDLSNWGYYGGQLPKVYDITNNNYTYIPELSFQEFNDIISGKQNASSNGLLAKPEDLDLEQKYNTNQVVFSMMGENGRDGYLINADQACHTGSHTPWYYISVHYAADAYITFWQSAVCNGHKGSFNPVCGNQDEPGQICNFNFQASSFRAYSGCHRQYASDGCESHSP
ncbi:hypothetical protein N7465_001621 [Penicillium sp. CMV-2018d]|nr:hypothetical protein N7465_001621 [Penicillium sp. CMV-2018d]